MIKFRVLNTITNKILRDSSLFNVFVQRDNGVGTVIFNSDDLRPLLYTGEKTVDGVEVYDGDIVEAVITTERGEELFTDHVHFNDTAWRLGNLDGTLADVVIRCVRGNIYESPWPVGAGG